MNDILLLELVFTTINNNSNKTIKNHFSLFVTIVYQLV